MGAKHYLKKHFRWSVDYLALRHENGSDFYLSCWQRNRSALPLLLVRLILFLGALATVVASLVVVAGEGRLAYWAIFNTQWALIMNVIATGLATAVSAVAYFKGPIDIAFGLPWYVRLYWAFYVIAWPLAILVTVFYYSLLTDAYPEGYEPDPVFDVFIHGINSVVMFLVTFTSLTPLYFAQCFYVIGYLLIYMIFSIIYYFAGGTGPLGDPWIYPILDWSDPGPTVGLVFACMGVVTAIVAVATLLGLLRDYLGHKCTSTSTYSF